MGAHDLANGRTVVGDPDLCVSDDGRTAGGTRGRGRVGLVSCGYRCILALAMGAPARHEKGRPMLRERIKNGLMVLGLGTMLVVGAGWWGMAAAAPQAPAHAYTGQVESIHIDHCDLEPGTCAGTLVLAQAGDHEVTLTIPTGTTIRRGDERVHLEQLGVGNYVTVQAAPVPSDRDLDDTLGFGLVPRSYTGDRVGTSSGERTPTLEESQMP
jgi:hypothetical protein